MKKFWKIVMLTVLCVSLLCGVTAMAEADRFQFEKTNLTVFEGNTLELSLIRQGNCAADGELTFVSGRENIATVDENGAVIHTDFRVRFARHGHDALARAARRQR